MTTILLLLITFFLGIVHLLLSLLDWVLPEGITNAFETAIGYTAYFTGILPVQEIMTAMLALLAFEIIWYGAKLAFKLFHMIPWVGKKIDIK